jgi:predicted CoA-substrate-specific enzyme activase
MFDSLLLGIDIGSVTTKVVVVDKNKNLLAWRYARSHGKHRATLLSQARSIAEEFNLDLDELTARVAASGFTGSGGRAVAELLGGEHVNELVAQTRALGEYCPQARTVIEVGGQDSKFLSVVWDETIGQMVLVDMALNNLCAAGTGAFLDRQAERLGISIEREFAELALKSETPARIAGRCTVFAKSDMTHLQQKGTPLPDILAGVSLALARNFTSVIGHGKAFVPPIVIQGGVAFNRAVVRAFAEVLKVDPADIIVPEHHHIMAALGTAFFALDARNLDKCIRFKGFDPLRAPVLGPRGRRISMPPLSRSGGNFARRGNVVRLIPPEDTSAATPIYLGVDVGSTTAKVVAIDEAGRLLARRYSANSGKPLEIVTHDLLDVGRELGESVSVSVLGVGTTGSGRLLTADFVGADVVRSEITAQARAAVAIDSEVDTIFEIGGQDSKFIRLVDGIVVDFAMNNACAAGTGSFLEEQAERLDIPIRQEFSRQAFCSSCPAALGERCTVFMESDLVHHQQQGARVEDLTAGLGYAIVENYMNRVVGHRNIGQHIFLQGGVAFNDAVVAAFRQHTGRAVIVPPNHDVSGAIGAALQARDEREESRQRGETSPSCFRGFDLRGRTYQSKTVICRACPNLCEVNRMSFEGEPPLFYGARCDIFEKGGRIQQLQQDVEIRDLFSERETLLMGDYQPPRHLTGGRSRVGIPRTLHFYDLFPYWRNFFGELGMDIILSSPTNPSLARHTRELAIAETCYPAKLVYGHVAELLEQKPDVIFAPSLLNRENTAPNQEDNAYCPIIRAAGHMVGAAVGLDFGDTRLITSPLHMQWERFKRTELMSLAKELGVSRRKIISADKAAIEAQSFFYQQIRRKWHDVLADLRPDIPTLILVGRPYTLADAGVSQDLPNKLRKLGALPVPLDFLPLCKVDISEHYPRMFWRSGQDILAGASIVRQDPRLHAIYVTSFNCGPDSFIINYFRRLMAGKPYLELEVDEHTADAGIMTRCEAFLESLQVRRRQDAHCDREKFQKDYLHSVHV